MTMMNAVGGTSIHYYGNSWRFHPWDFKARSESIKRYGPNSIPHGSTMEDWPIAYADLEPYYDTIEHQIGVSGKAGNIQGKIDRAGNVYEGPRRREYPMPPLRDTEFTERMRTAAANLKWNPHRSPAAINSSKAGPARSRNLCPASVSPTLRVVRTNSATPSRDASLTYSAARKRACRRPQSHAV